MTIYIFFIILNLFFFIFYKKISKLVNIYDEPDGVRKLQKERVPLIGGILLYLNFLLIIILDHVFSFKILEDYLLLFNKDFFSLFIVSSLVFILGIYDDKYSISPNTKLTLTFIFCFAALAIDKNLIIDVIKLSFVDKEIFLGNFSYFFTILCFLLFINAFNMFDGINLQSAVYSSLIFLVMFFVYNLKLFSLLFLIPSFGYICLNFKSKSFLGDGGSFFLAYLISYIFIKLYNNNIILFADEIVLIMIIPGLDLLRVAVSRIILGKHPFSADNRHLHYLLLKKLGYIKTFFAIQIIVILPYLSKEYLSLRNSILLAIIFYIMLFIFGSLKTKQ